MRSFVRACLCSAALTSCRNVTQSDSGKIPITSRSGQAVQLFASGRVSSENLQPHEAFAQFAQAVALDSTFALAEYGLASTAPTAKQVREHLDKAIALARNASLGEQLLIRAMQARINADPAAVRQRAESLVTRYPRDERAHWVLGNAYSAQRDYGKAVEQFQQAIAINPQFSLAYNSLGYAFRPMGDNVAAEHAFQQYIALVPNDPNPYDSYAELLMKLGRFDESIAQYNKAQSIDPHFSGSFVGIAANHMLAGRYPEAIAEANRYWGLARDDHERRAALLTLALVHADHGGTDDALHALVREYEVAHAIGDTASMSADEINMADILLDAGRVRDASTRYAHAQALVMASSLSLSLKQDIALLTRNNLARVAIARHDTISAFTEAITFMAGAESTHNGERIRVAHELNGLVALSVKQFDHSLAELALADLENPAVLYAMSLAHRGNGNRAKADQLLAQSVHMNILPTVPYVLVRAKANRTPIVHASAQRLTPP